MKQALAIKLKLYPDREQQALFREVQLAYREASNYTSQAAFEMGKSTNAAKVQDHVYAHLRSAYGLPSQLACSVPRYVCASYKTLWTRAKKTAQSRKTNPKIKPFKGLDKPARFSTRTVPLQYGKDYGFKTERRVSIQTLQGRAIVGYDGWEQHIAYLQDPSTHLGTGKLWYDRTKKTYYLLVSIEIEVPDLTASDLKNVVGVDLGQRYLLTASDTANSTLFICGGQAKQVAERYQRARKGLQQKGIRSATRRLIVLSRRERRFKQTLNHQTSSALLERYPHSWIGLEDLTHIRERTRHRKGKSHQQRRANRQQAKWSFAELQDILCYKALLQGSQCVKVDAHHTSQQCIRCGYTSAENRPNKGLLFCCENCGYCLHADLLGSRNIALRTLLIRQDWMRTGALSMRPDVTSDEAKAERRQRHSELRWSSVTSRRACPGGY